MLYITINVLKSQSYEFREAFFDNFMAFEVPEICFSICCWPLDRSLILKRNNQNRINVNKVAQHHFTNWEPNTSDLIQKNNYHKF